MLILSYLAFATLVYSVAYLRAPALPELSSGIPARVEVIELFPHSEEERKAA